MRPLPLLVFAACSEYDLSGGKDPATGGTTTPTTSTTTLPTTPTTPTTFDEDCPDPVFEGFDATVDKACYREIETGTFTPVLEWDMQSFPGPAGTEVMSTPIVVDVDLDGLPDIVFVTYNPGVVRVVKGDGSAVLWSNDTAGVQPQGGVAAADLDGDGYVEIVSLRPSGVAILEHDGTIKTVIDNLATHIYGISDVASISDMDHDGVPEIIAGRAILNADGTLRAAGGYGMGSAGTNVGSCSFAVDLDLDGVEEVVTGNAAYRIDGSTLWYTGGADGYPAAGNFDADPEGEVVASGGGQLRFIDHDGTPLGSVSIPGASTSSYGGPPTVADFDGDGEAEIGVASGSRYSVIETDGTINWQAITDDSSSGNTGSAVFDFEGDGVAEVVYADQTTLWVFDGLTGAVKLASTDHSNATWLEYPTVADVDADGHAEIVVANTYYGPVPRTGIAVFGDLDESWQPGRQIWNQHAYFITNINDDGTVPTTAATNWATYNNFRSGDLTAGQGSDLSDLAVADPGSCEIDCDEDRIVLWIHPGNEGLADVFVADLPVLELYAESGGVESFVDSVALADVYSGEYGANVTFDVSGLGLATIDAFIVRIASIQEDCDPANNEHRWEGPFCAE